MGCDIHVHVEYQKTVNSEKKWLCGDYFYINPYKYDKDEPDYCTVGLCEDRNYARFATLANVRNYGDTPYIDTPRGLPKDVTAEVERCSEEWGIDGHSRSYFTLKELIDYQKNIPLLRRKGMIGPDAIEAFEKYGVLPDTWCQGTNQHGWEFRSWEEENQTLVPLIDALKKRADELYVIYDFLWESDPLRAYELSDNIRIVFWFDN